MHPPTADATSASQRAACTHRAARSPAAFQLTRSRRPAALHAHCQSSRVRVHRCACPRCSLQYRARKSPSLTLDRRGPSPRGSPSPPKLLGAAMLAPACTQRTRSLPALQPMPPCCQQLAHKVRCAALLPSFASQRANAAHRNRKFLLLHCCARCCRRHRHATRFEQPRRRCHCYAARASQRCGRWNS